MEVAGNATILSVEETDVDANGNILVLITLLAPQGGSRELTEQVFSRFNATAVELGIDILEPVVRFGEFLAVCCAAWL